MLLSKHIRRIYKTLSLFFISFIVLSCANGSYEFWRQVPIQLSRVAQQETYKQWFIIPTEDIKKLKNGAKEHALDKRMDEIFTEMLGSVNWQYLKNHYGTHSIRNELIEEKIQMEGLLNFITYLDLIKTNDSDEKHIVIEGSGRYFAIRSSDNPGNSKGAILMTGDFKIFPQRYSIKDLDKGCIPLDINLYTTRIPGETTYYKESIIRYDLIMNNSRKHNKTYSIDYNAHHNAYLDLNNNKTFEKKSELIARMKINSSHSHVKIFDLSGSEFIKNTYNITTDEKTELDRSINKDKNKMCVKHQI